MNADFAICFGGRARDRNAGARRRSRALQSPALLAGSYDSCESLMRRLMFLVMLVALLTAAPFQAAFAHVLIHKSSKPIAECT